MNYGLAYTEEVITKTISTSEIANMTRGLEQEQKDEQLEKRNHTRQVRINENYERRH